MYYINICHTHSIRCLIILPIYQKNNKDRLSQEMPAVYASSFYISFDIIGIN